jgi:glycosyltransferase involved in cell wall biosynthesis
MALVSIIIPTYNRREWLIEAVDSVLAQTARDFQLLVIDDGSTDGTGELFPHADARVAYQLVKHGGVSAARNAGIQQCNSRYIAFLDSDDQWQPRKLEKQFACFDAERDTRICYTDEIWIRNGVRVNQKIRHGKYDGDIFRYALPLCMVSPSSVMITRDVFDEFGLFDETLPACEDYDLWLRLSARVPFRFLAEPLIIKRGGHDDQLSRAHWGMDRFRIFAMVKLMQTVELNAEQEQLTIAELERKARVYAGGLEKRNRNEELSALQEQIAPWVTL